MGMKTSRTLWIEDRITLHKLESFLGRRKFNDGDWDDWTMARRVGEETHAEWKDVGA